MGPELNICLSDIPCTKIIRRSFKNHQTLISSMDGIDQQTNSPQLRFGKMRQPYTGVPGSHPNIVLGMLGRMELRTPSIPKSHPKSFGQCKRNTNVDRMNS